MTKNNKFHLGKVEVRGKGIPISPTHDIFTSYMYKDPKNAETLRNILNIFTRKYLKQCKHAKVNTDIQESTGDILIETQYERFKNPDNKQETLRQDIKMTEHGDKPCLRYVEFQNDAYPKKQIEIRALEYLGYSVSADGSTLVSQQWILSENPKKLLHGLPIEVYRLAGECSGRPYPVSSHIMFASLSALAKEEDEAGELAKFLLGIAHPTNQESVKKIAKQYNEVFQSFKSDKEVGDIMSAKQEWEAKGIAIGEAKGIAKGIAKGEAKGIVLSALKLIQKGKTIEETTELLDLTQEQVETLKPLINPTESAA